MRINQIVWQHGGMAALISVILSLVAYILGVEMLVGWQIGVAQALLILITMVVVSRTIRSNEGGFISFKRLLGHILLSNGCILFAAAMFNVILFNFIAPDLIESVIEFTIEKAEAMMISFGLDEKLLEETMIETEKGIREGYTFIGAFKGMLYGSIFWAIPGLVVAGILKQNPSTDSTFS